MSHVSEQQLIDWRRELHSWPELSGHEVETTARLRRWLQDAGLHPLDYTLETGVVVEVGRGESLIALRADIDALPIHEATGLAFRSRNAGVMHACGHDVHSAVMLGAALQLKAIEDQLPGRVRILFQPAEENATGARKLINAGVLQHVQAIFGMHNEPGLPTGTFATRGGAFYANADKFVVHVSAKGAELNAGIDSVLVASQIIQALQSLTSRSFNTLDSLVLSVTRIEAGKGGSEVPAEAEFGGTVRTHDKQVRAELEQRARQIVENIAAANGAHATFSWHPGPPVLENDVRWAQFASQIAQEVGYRVQTAELHLGGEDFAYYLQQIPGAFVSIGSASEYGLHHGSFNPDEALIAPAAHFFTQLAQQALQHLNARCRDAILS